MRNKPLPQAPQAEMGVIASVILDPKTWEHISPIVQPGDFLDPACRTIFSMLDIMAADGAAIDNTALLERLRSNGDLDRIGGLAFLVKVVNSEATPAHAVYHAELVREAAQKRRLEILATKIGEHARNGELCADALEFARSGLAEIDERQSPLLHKPQSLDALKTKHPELRASVVGGLLREAEIGNFVSSPKVGKSWLAYSLGLSIVSGMPWLERFPTHKGKVLLVDNELHPETIAYRVPMVAEALGIADVADFHVHSMRGQLLDIFQLGKFFQQFKPGDYRLVILDALYRLWPAGMSENENAQATAVMNQITAYAERMGAAFALVHHSSKGAQGNKNVADVGAGAGAIARAADTHLVLREHETEGAVVLEARTRSWEQPAPMVLKWQFPVWTPADDLDPAALKATGGSTGSKPNRLSAIIAKVKDALAVPMTKNRLKKLVGCNGTEIKDAIDYLIEQGEIEPCQVVTDGGSFNGFGLKVGKVGKVGNSDPY